MNILFTHSISQLCDLLDPFTSDSYIYITDSNCRDKVLPLINCIDINTGFTFPAGEHNKTHDSFLGGIDTLHQAGITRNGVVINIGGGVTTDLGGFIAATYMRGISFINIPTSLMAMVDASLGGKVGINHNSLKNYIGAFAEPTTTIICPPLLKTLPSDELLSGFAEVLKHGLIMDRSYWNSCKQIRPSHMSDAESEEMIKRSIGIKMSVVEQDPTEKGLRKILNFGHTVGHAIESTRLKVGHPLKHGMAIAAGMICETYISNKINGLPDNQTDEIYETLIRHFPDVAFDASDIPGITDLCRADKKNQSDDIRMSLLSQIGQCSFDITANADLISESLHFYLGLFA